MDWTREVKCETPPHCPDYPVPAKNIPESAGPAPSLPDCSASARIPAGLLVQRAPGTASAVPNPRRCRGKGLPPLLSRPAAPGADSRQMLVAGEAPLSPPRPDSCAGVAQGWHRGGDGTAWPPPHPRWLVPAKRRAGGGSGIVPALPQPRCSGFFGVSALILGVPAGQRGHCHAEPSRVDQSRDGSGGKAEAGACRGWVGGAAPGLRRSGRRSWSPAHAGIVPCQSQDTCAG